MLGFTADETVILAAMANLFSIDGAGPRSLYFMMRTTRAGGSSL